MFGWLTERRRRHILEAPWPGAWDEIAATNVGAWALLDDAERARLRQLAQVFLAEKRWEGCGGLELTDEIRVTIAIQGCVLILGRDHDLFARLVSILVYPSTVLTPSRNGEEPVAIAGQAFRGDVVILVWDQVLRGARDPRDGRNVVLHELAHAIDFLDGAADGTPPLDSRDEYRTWTEVCSAAFLALRGATEDADARGVLRTYAAVNEAEFFAVATEAFFERPRALRDEQPALYDVLARFYRIDLASRASHGSAS
jgi:hypothetical protein